MYLMIFPYLHDLLRGRGLLNDGSYEGQCVYVVQPELGGPFKIGKTTVSSLDSRISSLQTSSPWRLTLRSLWRGGHQLEQDLHAELVALRLEGEWFAAHPSLELVLSIKGDHSVENAPLSTHWLEYDHENGGEIRVPRKQIVRAWYKPAPCWVGEGPENHGYYDAVRELSRMRGRHFNDDHQSRYE